MAVPSGLRIGDAEREAAAARLREHFAVGRLTMEEFQQRLDAVFAAKTDRDLARITSDLPGFAQQATTVPAGGFQSGGPAPYGYGPGEYGPGSPGWRQSRRLSYIRVAILLAVVLFVLLPALRWPAGWIVLSRFPMLAVLIGVLVFGRRALFRLLHPRARAMRGRGRRPW